MPPMSRCCGAEIELLEATTAAGLVHMELLTNSIPFRCPTCSMRWARPLKVFRPCRTAATASEPCKMDSDSKYDKAKSDAWHALIRLCFSENGNSSMSVDTETLRE